MSWSKLLKYLTRYISSNIKLLLEHREYIIKGRTNYHQFLGRFLQNPQEKIEKIGQFFQVAIHFNPGHPQPKIINTSFCALVGELLTNLNRYFNVSVDTDMIFGYSK